MKTKSIFMAAIMIAVAVSSVVANDNNDGLVVFRTNGTEVFKVVYKGKDVKTVRLNVYDHNADLVFAETIYSRGGFILPLNFSGLESGQYTIELNDATGKHVEKVNYLPMAEVSRMKSTTYIHVSRLVNENDKYMLTVTSKENSIFNIAIYDESNNLIHMESKEVTGDFAQLYSVKNVSGPVTFAVSSKDTGLKKVSFQ